MWRTFILLFCLFVSPATLQAQEPAPSSCVLSQGDQPLSISVVLPEGWSIQCEGELAILRAGDQRGELGGLLLLMKGQNDPFAFLGSKIDSLKELEKRTQEDAPALLLLSGLFDDGNEARFLARSWQIKGRSLVALVGSREPYFPRYEGAIEALLLSLQVVEVP